MGYLSTEGYRQGVVPFPVRPLANCPAAPTAAAAKVDQAELGTRWRAIIIDNKWWRDPDLTLSTLAQRLGTNTTALSRALNEGLGLNFNEVINRLRVDAVIAAMNQTGDAEPVLDIALSEGFNSKASFNRVFKLYTGETPTEYRRRAKESDQVSSSE